MASCSEGKFYKNKKINFSRHHKNLFPKTISRLAATNKYLIAKTQEKYILNNKRKKKRSNNYIYI